MCPIYLSDFDMYLWEFAHIICCKLYRLTGSSLHSAPLLRKLFVWQILALSRPHLVVSNQFTNPQRVWTFLSYLPQTQASNLDRTKHNAVLPTWELPSGNGCARLAAKGTERTLQRTLRWKPHRAWQIKVIFSNWALNFLMKKEKRSIAWILRQVLYDQRETGLKRYLASNCSRV